MNALFARAFNSAASALACSVTTQPSIFRVFRSGDGTDDGKVEFVEAGDAEAEDMSLMSGNINLLMGYIQSRPSHAC